MDKSARSPTEIKLTVLQLSFMGMKEAEKKASQPQRAWSSAISKRVRLADTLLLSIKISMANFSSKLATT
jgi:hypothetical protein